jgi:ribosomal protein S18 acetylase RimI-like enzyme
VISRIREIEEAMYSCWPAAEVCAYDGWQLRFAGGFSRRANSVYPAAPSTVSIDEKLDWCRTWFAERGLDLVVRQNPATESGLDEVLAALGFEAEGRTQVMTALLPAAGPRAAAGVLTAEWREAAASLWGITGSQREAWEGILGRIVGPANFALVRDRSGNAIAVGVGVVSGRWLNLFELIVATTQRRSGVGTTLTRELQAWGAANGARHASLQVVAENDAALAFYRHLGFELAYTYWYRRLRRRAVLPGSGE